MQNISTQQLHSVLNHRNLINIHIVVEMNHLYPPAFDQLEQYLLSYSRSPNAAAPIIASRSPLSWAAAPVAAGTDVLVLDPAVVALDVIDPAAPASVVMLDAGVEVEEDSAVAELIDEATEATELLMDAAEEDDTEDDEEEEDAEDADEDDEDPPEPPRTPPATVGSASSPSAL